MESVMPNEIEELKAVTKKNETCECERVAEKDGEEEFDFSEFSNGIVHLSPKQVRKIRKESK